MHHTHTRTIERYFHFDYGYIEENYIEKIYKPKCIQNIENIKLYLGKYINKSGVYEFYTKDKSLYIGRAKNLNDRPLVSLKERVKSLIMHEEVYMSIYPVHCLTDARILEIYLINKKKPLLNVQYTEKGNTKFRLNVPKRTKPIQIVLESTVFEYINIEKLRIAQKELKDWIEKEIIDLYYDWKYLFTYGLNYSTHINNLNNFLHRYFMKTGNFNYDKYFNDIQELEEMYIKKGNILA